MPKDKSGYSKRLRSSPYHRSSGRSLPINKKDSDDNIKEWEEARCPVCMEHPHNAVLLVCSSRNKGCRPYMCDTSHRHSNCLDQFRKTFAEMPKDEESIDASPVQGSRNTDGVNDQTLAGDDKKLVCPLCRGQVNGWIVVEGARRLMNAKSRSCACETCEYSGTYEQLRNHARVEHPSARPSEADPERQRDWTRMERERDLRDIFSMFQPEVVEDGNVGVPIFRLQFLVVFSVARSSTRRQTSRTSSMEDVDIEYEQAWTPGTSRSPARSSRRRRTSRSSSMEDINTEFEQVRTHGRSPSPARSPRRQQASRTSSTEDIDTEFEQIGTPGRLRSPARSSRRRLNSRSSGMEDIDTEYVDFSFDFDDLDSDGGESTPVYHGLRAPTPENDPSRESTPEYYSRRQRRRRD
ncbi:hypothetical protein ACHQM5_002458 [Ranunculus cassubicifolius]